MTTMEDCTTSLPMSAVMAVRWRMVIWRITAAVRTKNRLDRLLQIIRSWTKSMKTYWSNWLVQTCQNTYTTNTELLGALFSPLEIVNFHNCIGKLNEQLGSIHPLTGILSPNTTTVSTLSMCATQLISLAVAGGSWNVPRLDNIQDQNYAEFLGQTRSTQKNGRVFCDTYLQAIK